MTENKDNATPTMSDQVDTVQSLQDELNSKLAEFDRVATAKHVISLNEFKSLEKELHDLRKFAETNTNKDSIELENKIKIMNTRIGSLAKESLNEWSDGAKCYQILMGEIERIIDKLMPIIEACEIDSTEKEEIKNQFIQFKSVTQAKAKEADDFINEISEFVKNGVK